MKTLLLGATLSLLCSCSFFAKKEPDVYLPKLPDKPAREDLSTATVAPYGTLPAQGKAGALQKETAAQVERSRPVEVKEEIAFSIKGSDKLNRFRNSAHALHVCLYQLKDPNAFSQVAEEQGGMAKLLECSRFDGSVASAKRIVVQPGQLIRENRLRAEGARYLGIATGYYGTGKHRTFQLAPLSMKDGTLAGRIDIELGPNEIENVTVN